MIIGIVGWGLWCKFMVFVWVILCLDVIDLMVVIYGGLDLGLLCLVGKVKWVYYGFVLLDLLLFYDLWFVYVCISGVIEVWEMDEGMLCCGL